MELRNPSATRMPVCPFHAPGQASRLIPISHNALRPYYVRSTVLDGLSSGRESARQGPPSA